MKLSIVFLVAWVLLGAMAVAGALGLAGFISTSWTIMFLPLAAIAAVVPLFIQQHHSHTGGSRSARPQSP